MSYVIAFEDDGSAKDVTRRYAQWYNAKTRKQRVESTKRGEQWWGHTMAVFQKPFMEVRDEIEDADFIKRAESEAMPRNVQDFRGHPVYVLERHLRMNEVIHPRHEVGKVSAGVSKNAKLESVFRRRNVHLCRTADTWYRRGRDVIQGEQPLKRVTPKRKREHHAENSDIDESGDEEGMALYAEYQTTPYEPPPVVDGQIPRNGFGNLDVYVPSMIPAGGVHIRHPLAAKAARILDIDFAEAVTGFEFKGRQGTAVIDGVVVGIDMCNAMVHVIEGLESEATTEAQETRSAILLGMWKRWLTALRIRDRVQREYGDRERDEEDAAADEDEDEDVTYAEDEDDDGGEYGGGFMPEAMEEDDPAAEAKEPMVNQPSFPNLKPMAQLLPAQVVHQEIIVVRSPNKLPQKPSSLKQSTRTAKIPLADDTKQNGDLLHDDEVGGGGGGFLPDDEAPINGTSLPDNEGGGFLPEVPDEEGGGFIPDEEESLSSPTQVDLQQMNTARDTNTTTAPTIKVTDGDGAVGLMSDLTAGREAMTTSDADLLPPTAKASDGLLDMNIGNASPRSETSLLSHDPDEEDAEPEWLLNSLGEMD
jgi:xeroderma pigmentosum group C-complementing protein